MASTYRQFKQSRAPDQVPGFCRAANIDEVRSHGYVLTPGRYVGSKDVEEDDEPFEEKLPRLTAELEQQFEESHELEVAIRANLANLISHVA